MLLVFPEHLYVICDNVIEFCVGMAMQALLMSDIVIDMRYVVFA